MARSSLNGFKTPLRVTLKPSRLMYGLMVGFSLCCAGAMAYAAVPRSGIGVGICAAGLVGWIVWRIARCPTRKCPVTMEIGPTNVVIWHNVDKPVRDVRIRSVCCWSSLLLSITFQRDGCLWGVWILADALPREAMRELIVRLKILAIRGGGIWIAKQT